VRAPARVLTSLGIVLALGACGLSRPEVARVGDHEIGEADLRHATALQRVIADLQGTPCGQPVAGEPASVACDRIALSVELRFLAITDYAAANGISPSDGDVARAVDQLETQVGRQTLDDALRAHGLERDDLFELGRKILTIREVRSAVAEDRIGEQEIRALYRERVAEFTVVRVDHILVETEAEATRVYERIKDASERQFVALARRVSIEPGAGEGGGELGSATASTFAPEFAAAAIALEPGEVSLPVQTRFGWHVIYLVDEQVTPYEEAKPSLIEPLADREFQAWLQERAGEMTIEVNPRFGHFVLATFAIEPVRSTDPDADAATPAP
jgi:parvulin-like peptidyl-prolyl isomerase